MVEKEMKQMGKAWGGIQDYIAALHAAQNNGARVSE